MAAASLTVISPPATAPAAAVQVVPLNATCSQLNAMVGRPTNAHIVGRGVRFVSDPGSDNRYTTGETISIEVELSLNVRFDVRTDLNPDAEPLSVDFMLGGNAPANLRKAVTTPERGEGTNRLTFEYTVQSGDTHQNTGDLWIPENSVRAEDHARTFGGTSDINTVGAGVPHQSISGPCGGSNLEHPAVFHPRSTGSPTIVSRPKIMSEPIDGDTYYAGEKIWVRVEYSKPVTVTGTPVLKLRFGDATDANPTYKDARYVSDSTSNPPADPRRRSSMTRLLFEYEVQSTDSDPDGISIDWGSLSGGSITAMDNGVAATNYHDDLEAQFEYKARVGGDPTVAKHLVDGSRGPLTSQEMQDTSNPTFVPSYTTRVVSEPATGTTLHEGEYVVVRADFSGAVIVDDERLELPIQLSNCHNDDFSHRNRLSGTDLEDYDDELEELGCLDSNGNQIDPTLMYAKYLPGSGHTRLLFYYQVTNNDKDRDGIVVPSGRFTYDGGKPIDESNQNIFRAADGGTLYTHYSDVFEKPLKYQRVDGKAVEGPPIIEALEVTSMPLSGDSNPPDTYGFGETIKVRVTFNQAVRVTGTPKLTLNLQSGPKDAAYDSGDDSKLLFFHYTVEAGDLDGNGISIDANSLKSNDDTNDTIVADDDGEDASLDHRQLGTQGGHKVDAMAPTITGLSITSDPPNNGAYYGSNSVIQIKVTYDDPVRVSGTDPTLSFEIGTEPRTATYEEADDYDHNDGTRELIFEYTVFSPDADSDGIRVPTGRITLGTIESVSPNPIPADLDFEELRTQSGHKVETVAPTVESPLKFTSSGSDCDSGTYLAGEYICVEVTFDTDDDSGDSNDDGDVPSNGSTGDRAIWVDTPLDQTPPTLTLDIDGSQKEGTYHRGSGSGTKLIFRYEVEAGLFDDNGVSVVANSLRLNDGEITDTAGNSAVLAHDLLSGTTVESVDSVVPELSNLRIASSPPNSGPPDYNDTYGRGDDITFEVDFSEDVVRSGTPLLRFQIGDDQVNPVGNNRDARYKESSPECTDVDTTNTCTLTFTYTVGSDDDDNDGISVDLDTGAGETTAISGTIKDRTGNPADLSHSALGDDGGHKVDAQPPRVSTVEITSTAPQLNNTYYKLRDIITVEVTFDDPIEVTLDDGDADLDDDPRIALRMRSGPEYADYIRLDGDNTMVFEYAVDNDDLDTDGIGIPSNAIQLRDATIADPQGQNASLSHLPVPDSLDQKVDGVAPTVTSVEVDSDPPRKDAPYRNDAYGVYSTSNEVPILIKVTFSEPVQLSIGSSIDLTIGTTTAISAEWDSTGYVATAGLREAVFKYEVESTDENDADGISIDEDSLSGTITDLVGNDAILAHSAQSNLAGHEVDTTAPTVRSVAITSPSPEGDSTYENYYAEGDTIMVTVTFSEKVAVNGTGVPTINLNIGGTTRAASFQPGDGRTDGDNTTKLMFSYVVVAGDMDSDGISIDDGQTTSQIQLPNGSTITDLPGNEADLGHDALTDDGEHKVNGDLDPRGPYATAISMFEGPDKLDTYRAGEHIFLDVTFSEAVAVGGTPMLPIVVGNQKEANYFSKPNASTLRFRYTAQVDDEDTDGVSVTAVNIDLNNGSIRATDDNMNALLGVPALTDQSAHLVDGVAPTVSSGPNIEGGPDGGQTYGKGETIELSVTFDENVIVTGTPYLRVKIGNGYKNANFSGPASIPADTGVPTLNFSYIVRPGDKDDDGISIDDGRTTSQIRLPSGAAITDPVGNDADLHHDQMLDNGDHKVDGGDATTNPPGNGNTGGGNPDGFIDGGPVERDVDQEDGRRGIRVERIGGGDRFETAKLIAERYLREVGRDTSLPASMRKVDTVIIASGRAFPDALTASALAGTALSPIALSGPALAGAHNAPLLLVEPNDMTEFTREFLTENKIKHVYIVGGPAAVSNEVEAAIAALPSVTSVVRFGGADRYATSVSISSEVITTMGGAAEFCGTTLRTALLATGTDFADALALAPIAAKGPHPLLLTRRDDLPDSVRTYFAAALADGSIEQIIVAGGPSAVSDDVIDGLTEMGFSVVRIGGADRYDTAVRIARYALRSGVNGHGTCLDNDRIGLATGVVYADGLAGGPLLARMGGASILLEPDALPTLVEGFLAWHRLDHEDLTLTVFGGPEALSYAVVRLARNAAERGLK